MASIEELREKHAFFQSLVEAGELTPEQAHEGFLRSIADPATLPKNRPSDAQPAQQSGADATPPMQVVSKPMSDGWRTFWIVVVAAVIGVVILVTIAALGQSLPSNARNAPASTVPANTFTRQCEDAMARRRQSESDAAIANTTSGRGLALRAKATAEADIARYCR